MYCTINLHLHCHLADCVKDFGPVYVFWLFAYKRLNGIMHGFLLHKIFMVEAYPFSLITERFLDMSAYIPSKWPTEYVDEFLPILERFKYQQGSLIQNTVETATNKKGFVCDPVAPIHECCWQPSEIQLEQVCQSVTELNASHYQILMVTRRTKRLMLNDCYLSCDNRSRKSIQHIHVHVHMHCVSKLECHKKFNIIMHA